MVLDKDFPLLLLVQESKLIDLISSNHFKSIIKIISDATNAISRYNIKIKGTIPICPPDKPVDFKY